MAIGQASMPCRPLKAAVSISCRLMVLRHAGDLLAGELCRPHFVGLVVVMGSTKT